MRDRTAGNGSCSPKLSSLAKTPPAQIAVFEPLTDDEQVINTNTLNISTIQEQSSEIGCWRQGWTADG